MLCVGVLQNTDMVCSYNFLFAGAAIILAALKQDMYLETLILILYKSSTLIDSLGFMRNPENVY